MKPLSHYIYWLKRDIARAVLRCKPVSRYLVNKHLGYFLSLRYFAWLGTWPDIKNPGDLNEGLLKLCIENRKDPELAARIAGCVDKYAVREYVKSKGYGDTLNELYGFYYDVEDIDFDSLPDSFVMKMNNASGRNLICKDKKTLDIPSVKKRFAQWL